MSPAQGLLCGSAQSWHVNCTCGCSCNRMCIWVIHAKLSVELKLILIKIRLLVNFLLYIKLWGKQLHHSNFESWFSRIASRLTDCWSAISPGAVHEMLRTKASYVANYVGCWIVHVVHLTLVFISLLSSILITHTRWRTVWHNMIIRDHNIWPSQEDALLAARTIAVRFTLLFHLDL